MQDIDLDNKAKSRYNEIVYQAVSEVHCLDKELLVSSKIKKKQHRLNKTKMQDIKIDERDRKMFTHV